MERIYSIETKNNVGKEVVLKGWVHTIRTMGKMIFMTLRDGSGEVQVIFLPNNKELIEQAKKLKSEYTIILTGVVNQRPENQQKKNEPTGTVEIEAKQLEITSTAKELPFDVDADLNLDTYLDNQPFTLRSKKNRAIFRVQTEIVNAFRDFLRVESFQEFQAPNIVPSATEGGANVFTVKYFDHNAYLGQSPQFYKQIMVGVFERVFCVTKAFRAEEHATSRHLNEYSSLDLEMGFIEDHTDIMKLENRLLQFMTGRLKEKCEYEFMLLGASLPEVPENIPHFKLTEVQEIIKKEFKVDCIGEPDLEPQHERLICEYATKQLHSEFVFVTHYPTSKRPMYTHPDPKDLEFTNSFDLLFRGLEVTTGGQRLNDYDTLVANIKKWGNDPELFSFYLQAFKSGMPPEGGLAIGLERLTQQFLGLSNVKEATLFPRDQVRIDVPLSTLKKE